MNLLDIINLKNDLSGFTVFVFLILILFIAVIYIIKLKKTNQKYLDTIGIQNKNLQNTVAQNSMRVSGMDYQFQTYRDMVNKNFRQVFSAGELILIDYFRKILSEPCYANWSIYGHLNIKGNSSRNYQVDFLIVSDKGIYVIESKLWNGLTFIYTNGTNNLFTDTQFYNFGRNSGCGATGIQVFNINRKDNGEGLEINKYTNPVEQAREYSKMLKDRFGVRVKNLVVFQQDDLRQVKINDRNLSYYDVDKYTRITTQNNLISDLKNLNSKEFIDIEKINHIIQTQFEYTIFLNSFNINQPPWDN